MLLAKGALVFAVLKLALIDSVNCDQWERLDTGVQVVMDGDKETVPSWRTEGCTRIYSWAPDGIYFDLCRYTATYISSPDLVLQLNAACSFTHPFTIGVEKIDEQAE